MPLLRPRVRLNDKPGSGRIMVAASDQDSLLSAIVKWIPVEVLTAYKAVDGFIPSDKFSAHYWFAWALTFLCPLWIAFATKPSDQKIAWRQVVIAPFAFLCWVIAIQNSLLQHFYPIWEAWMGSLVLGIGILVLPIMDGILKRMGFTQGE